MPWQLGAPDLCWVWDSFQYWSFLQYFCWPSLSPCPGQRFPSDKGGSPFAVENPFAIQVQQREHLGYREVVWDGSDPARGAHPTEESGDFSMELHKSVVWDLWVALGRPLQISRITLWISESHTKTFPWAEGSVLHEEAESEKGHELPGSFAYHCSHRGGLGLDLHLCPAVPQHGQALFTHIFLHLYLDLDYSRAIQAQGRATAWEPQLKLLRFMGLLATFGVWFP